MSEPLKPGGNVFERPYHTVYLTTAPFTESTIFYGSDMRIHKTVEEGVPVERIQTWSKLVKGAGVSMVGDEDRKKTIRDVFRENRFMMTVDDLSEKTGIAVEDVQRVVSAGSFIGQVMRETVQRGEEKTTTETTSWLPADLHEASQWYTGVYDCGRFNKVRDAMSRETFAEVEKCIDYAFLAGWHHRDGYKFTETFGFDYYDVSRMISKATDEETKKLGYEEGSDLWKAFCLGSRCASDIYREKLLRPLANGLKAEFAGDLPPETKR